MFFLQNKKVFLVRNEQFTMIHAKGMVSKVADVPAVVETGFQSSNGSMTYYT